MIIIKTSREIDLMREAGRRLSAVFRLVKNHVKPGVSTEFLDEIAHKAILERDAKPAFLNYEGFPKTLCTSVNEEVVHGIPSPSRILRDGDIISIDCGLVYKGYYSDMAATYPVGDVTDDVRKLIEVTRQSFYEGLKKCIAGGHLHDISAAIDDYVTPFGYGIVRDYVGHGVGSRMHEPPAIPNFRQSSKGPVLRSGMTLAIEPMITMGTYEVEVGEDDWCVTTKDKSFSAHFERTVLIGENGPEILNELAE